MPTGWFIVQPPAFSTGAAALKKVAPALTGGIGYDGSIAPIALRKLTVAMGGAQQPTGPMSVALRKLTVSMNGEQSQSGALAVTLPKVSHDFEQDLFTGALFSTLQPVRLGFALQTQGEIAAQLATVDATFASVQEYTGVLGARLREAAAIIAGSHSQDGVLAATARKTEVAATGNTPTPDIVGTAYAAAETVTAPAHQAGDTIIVFVSRIGSAAPALLSGWTNIVNGNRAVGTGNYSARIAYKVAASSAETIGTWTTTEQLIVLVVRNVASIGAATQRGIGGGSANTTVTYPAATLLGTNGKSRVLRFARGGGNAATGSDLLTNPISGYTLKEGNNLIVALESPLTSTNPVAQTQATASTSYWWTATVELRGN